MREIVIRTLSSEIRLRTDSDDAFEALSYVGADPDLPDRSLSLVDLTIHRRGAFYAFHPPESALVEGSLDAVLNGVFRLLRNLLAREAQNTALFHAATAWIEGRKFVVLGDKGFGKTTLMLKLIEHGAVVEGDEHTIVLSGGAITRPRRLHVKESSLQLVPSLAEAIREEPSMPDWMGQRVYACRPTFGGAPWRLVEQPIDHVIFAEPNFGGSSILTPMPQELAFGSMLAAAYMPDTNRGMAAAGLRTLSATAKSWRLQVGRLDQAVSHLRKISICG